MSSISRYDFEDRVLGSLRRRNGEATVGDVSTDTGLPYNDVEAVMRKLLAVYKSHLDVDDDGNLRYRFDPAFVRRGENKGRWWYELRKTVWDAFKFLFKIWIMVMLVGYTIVFILLLIALAVGAVAGSRGEGDSGGLVLLPLRLLARLLEWMFWIDLFEGNSRRRSMVRRQKKKVDKPFYQKVFDYVFGPEVEVDPLRAHQMFTQFVSANDGVVTASDWAAMTGQSLEEAETALTASVVRFNGDIDVSENGNLIYRFDDLLMSARASEPHRRRQKPIWDRVAKAPSLTGNPGGTNGWITAFNIFIMVMSGLVLSAGPAIEVAAIIGLGWIPLIFSLLFFAVPAYRWIRNFGAKKKAEQENLRRYALQKIFDSTLAEKAKPVSLDVSVATELATSYKGEPRTAQDGRTYYFFDQLAEEVNDGRRARHNRGQRVFGETIFSSDEEKVSLVDYDMEDFDRRLGIELEGSHVSFDFAEEAAKATVKS